MRDTFYTSVDFRSPASLSKVATMKSGFKNFFFCPGVFQLREPEERMNSTRAKLHGQLLRVHVCVLVCVCVAPREENEVRVRKFEIYLFKEIVNKKNELPEQRREFQARRAATTSVDEGASARGFVFFRKPEEEGFSFFSANPVFKRPFFVSIFFPFHLA